MQDYAKKQPYQPIEKSNDRSWLNTLLLILAFVFALAGIIHFAEKHDTRPSHLKKPIAAIQPEPQTQKIPVITHHKTLRHDTQTKHSHQRASHHKKTTPAVNIQPKYDFYKLLPEMTVNVPAPTDTTNNATTH